MCEAFNVELEDDSAREARPTLASSHQGTGSRLARVLQAGLLQQASAHLCKMRVHCLLMQVRGTPDPDARQLLREAC